MKKIVKLVIIIFIGLIAVKILTITPQGWKANLINPMGQKNQSIDASQTPVPTPNAPKTYSFDSSTDLKAELNKVSPQVLDSDFE